MFIVNEADTEYRQLVCYMYIDRGLYLLTIDQSQVRITRCQGAEEPCSNADIDTSYLTKCVQVRQIAVNGENLVRLLSSPSPKYQSSPNSN